MAAPFLTVLLFSFKYGMSLIILKNHPKGLLVDVKDFIISQRSKDFMHIIYNIMLRDIVECLNIISLWESQAQTLYGVLLV